MSESLGGLTATFTLKIYYEDTDLQGIVYHANYLKYFERARTECLAAKGIHLLEMAEQRDRQFVLRSLSIHYAKPARYGDSVVIHTRIGLVSKHKIMFYQEAYLETTQTQPTNKLCSGEFEVVCTDTNMKLASIPKDIYQEMLSES